MTAIEIIKHFRSNHWSLNKIADAIGVNHRTVHRWANNEVEISEEYLKNLKEFYRKNHHVQKKMAQIQNVKVISSEALANLNYLIKEKRWDYSKISRYSGAAAPSTISKWVKGKTVQDKKEEIFLKWSRSIIQELKKYEPIEKEYIERIGKEATEKETTDKPSPKGIPALSMANQRLMKLTDHLLTSECYGRNRTDVFVKQDIIDVLKIAWEKQDKPNALEEAEEEISNKILIIKSFSEERKDFIKEEFPKIVNSYFKRWLGDC